MELGVSEVNNTDHDHQLIMFVRVLIYMLGSGGVSPFWAGNIKNTQRKIIKAKYTTKIPAFDQLSEQIKQLIKR